MISIAIEIQNTNEGSIIITDGGHRGIEDMVIKFAEFLAASVDDVDYYGAVYMVVSFKGAAEAEKTKVKLGYVYEMVRRPMLQLMQSTRDLAFRYKSGQIDLEEQKEGM